MNLSEVQAKVLCTNLATLLYVIISDDAFTSPPVVLFHESASFFLMMITSAISGVPARCDL